MRKRHTSPMVQRASGSIQNHRGANRQARWALRGGAVSGKDSQTDELAGFAGL